MNTKNADMIASGMYWIRQLSQSAGCKNDFACKPAGIVRGKKRHDFGDVRWRTDAAQGRQGEEVLLEFASRAQQPGGPCAFAECGSGVDGVHPDFARGQFSEDRKSTRLNSSHT